VEQSREKPFFGITKYRHLPSQPLGPQSLEKKPNFPYLMNHTRFTDRKFLSQNKTEVMAHDAPFCKMNKKLYIFVPIN